MSAIVDLLGSEVESKDGKVQVSSFCGAGKVVGLYFSAHWCPPCRGFTPQLVEFYNTVKAAGKEFEIVFISSDRDTKSFEGYFKEMPWKALPFDDREKKEELSEKYGVRGIPTFIILDGNTGDVITGDGRSNVMKDPTGANFPYRQ
ncbi:hypothetical protein ScPMuIL_004448 [Solemya velum]